MMSWTGHLQENNVLRNLVASVAMHDTTVLMMSLTAMAFRFSTVHVASILLAQCPRRQCCSNKWTPHRAHRVKALGQFMPCVADIFEMMGKPTMLELSNGKEGMFA